MASSKPEFDAWLSEPIETDCTYVVRFVATQWSSLATSFLGRCPPRPKRGDPNDTLFLVRPHECTRIRASGNGAGNVLPSRLMFAPINTGFRGGHGRPSDRAPQALSRAAVRTGRSPSALSETSLVRREVGSNAGTAVLSDWSLDIPHSQRLRGQSDVMVPCRESSVSRSACRAIASQNLGEPGMSAAEVGRLRELIARYTAADLNALIDDFGRSAQLARDRAGFDLIQVHAAHGYLFSLLLTSEHKPRRRLTSAVDGEWFPQLDRPRPRSCSRSTGGASGSTGSAGLTDEAIGARGVRRLASFRAAEAGGTPASFLYLSAGAYTGRSSTHLPKPWRMMLAVSRAFAREILPACSGRSGLPLPG